MFEFTWGGLLQAQIQFWLAVGIWEGIKWLTRKFLPADDSQGGTG